MRSDTIKQAYSAPVIEGLEIISEEGFALSGSNLNEQYGNEEGVW
jgi:hypothetical protein